MSYKIITAVATEPVTLTEAKLHLKVDSTDDNDLITALITAAREAGEQYTQIGFAPQTLEMVLDEFPDDGEAIELELGPVASITHIKYTDTAGAEQTVSSADYALSTYGSVHRALPDYGVSWPDTQDVAEAVRVRYVTGYTTLPKAAKQAMLLLIGHWYRNREAVSDKPMSDVPLAALHLLNTVKVWSK